MDLIQKQKLLNILTPSLQFSEHETSQFVKHLKTATNIIALSHIAADHDALTSLIVFKHLASKITNTKVQAITESKIIDELSDLNSIKQIKVVPNIYEYLLKSNPSHVILLDINHVHRISAKANHIQLLNFLEHQTTTIILDHHLTPPNIKKSINLSKPYASTCELLFFLSVYLNIDISKVYKEIAIGTISDTNLLRSCQTKLHPGTISLELLNFLVQEGNLDIQEILNKGDILLKYSMLKYLQILINNIHVQDKIGYTFIDISNLKGQDYHAAIRATYYVILKIFSNMRLNAFFVATKQAQNKIYISLRGASKYPVLEIAEQLGGGGHTHAAAVTIKTSNLEKTVNQVYKLLKDSFTKHPNQHKQSTFLD